MEQFEKIRMSYKCPKTLDQLQPCEGNWHCDGCQQLVFDFRGMTEAQILNIFTQSGKKLCGIYDAERMKTLPQKSNWQKWASAAMVALSINLSGQSGKAQNTAKFTGTQKSNDHPDSLKATYTLGEVAIIPSAYYRDGYMALQKYLHQRINYSGTFKGQALVTFNVEKNGSLTGIKIVNPTQPALDNKIVQVLSTSKNWMPLIQNGRPVKSVYRLTINFPYVKDTD